MRAQSYGRMWSTTWKDIRRWRLGVERRCHTSQNDYVRINKQQTDTKTLRKEQKSYTRCTPKQSLGRSDS